MRKKSETANKNEYFYFAKLRKRLRNIINKFTKLVITLNDDSVSLKQSLFVGLAAFSIFACGLLFMYGAYIFARHGQPTIAVIEIIAYALLVCISILKRIRIEVRSFIIILLFYAFSTVLLLATGNTGGGLVAIVSVMFLSGIMLDSKKLYGFIAIDVFVFAVITYLMLTGRFEGTKMGAFGHAWIINMLTTQTCGIGLMFLIHIVYNVLDKRNIELKASKENLQKSEERKTLLLSNANGIIYSCSFSEHRTMEYVSDGCFELTGYTPESIVMNRDMKFCDLVLDEYKERTCDGWLNALHSKGNYRLEYPIITAGGKEKWVIDQGKCICNDDGEIESIEGIIIDITDRYKREQLIAEKERAEAATKAKGEFLATMSHEIRTPMNAVIGLNRLLKKTDLSNTQADYVFKIDSSASHLLNVINNILDFSKIESNEIHLESIEFSLDQVINDQFNIVSLKAYEKGIDLVLDEGVDISDNLIGDPHRLGQILCNLLNNAIKFTETGHVLLKVSMLEQVDDKIKLKFNIIDTGIGMTKEQVGKLFKPFTQADSTITRKYGGTGLGLVITKQLVELMGGEIAVTSDFGNGSNFEFTVDFETSVDNDCTRIESPDISVLVMEKNEIISRIIHRQLKYSGYRSTCVLTSSAALEVLKRAHYHLIITSNPKDFIDNAWDDITTLYSYRNPPKLLFVKNLYDDLSNCIDINTEYGVLTKPVSRLSLNSAITDLFIENDNETMQYTTESIDKSSGQKHANSRILIVEDNEINMLIIREMLLNQGFEVDEASNGVEAVNAINTKSYSIVLMDIQMPILDGYEATKIIREKYSKEALPIIALSADVMADSQKKAIDTGMNDYLSKPIDSKQLFNTISNYADEK